LKKHSKKSELLAQFPIGIYLFFSTQKSQIISKKSVSAPLKRWRPVLAVIFE
jgi:hypothetical protein